MAAPPAALPPPPRLDHRYRIRVEVRPIEPSPTESEFTVEVVTAPHGLVLGFVEVLQHLFNDRRPVQQDTTVVNDFLRFIVQGGMGGMLNNAGQVRPRDVAPDGGGFVQRPRNGITHPPPNDIRFEPLQNGRARCSRCQTEVETLEVYAHAMTHAPPVVNMHEVPADGPPVPDDGAVPLAPEGAGSVA